MLKINFTVHIRWIALVSIPVTLFVGSSFTKTAGIQESQHKGGYKLVDNWPDLPVDYQLGQVTGVGIDTNQHVLLFHRAGRVWTDPFPITKISASTILELDGTSGKILKSWGENVFIMPHGLTVDRENNVWLTDVALHQVFKFTHDGKLVFKIGMAGISGNDSLHFNMPTDVAVCKDGSFYVSDGYGNSRVVKFSKTGEYLFEWGQKGEARGEFNTPHAIDLDKDGNVLVADRENNRIQKFDASGKFIREWKNDQANGLYSLTIGGGNQLYAIDYVPISGAEGTGSDILFLNSRFKVNQRLGRSGGYTGSACRYHDISVDKNGNLYVGDIWGNRIQKFSK